MSEVRIETDSLGEVKVSADALYGAQTERARQNFPVSGLRIPRRMIRALGLVKKACAEVNFEKRALDERMARAIIQAADEVAQGDHDAWFVVDIFQTGSGTSSNMNANEVIANRAAQILGESVGGKAVHPNDHVNKGQSSNDIIPTAIHIAAAEAVERDLLPALRDLAAALWEKAKAFDDVVKIGRTHLMDAVPVRLGQEFSGYATQVQNGVRRVEAARAALTELALGGTAVGTGLNAEPGFAAKVIEKISAWTSVAFKQAPNLFEALAARDAEVEMSGALRSVAVSLIKVANDIRWLGSGPRCGIGEILIPDLQPGSSIMPGKVNPVMSEMMMMVCAQVIGNDAAIAVGGQHGNFELNVMKPMIAYNLLQSIEILGRAASTFAARCVRGLDANRARCEEMIEKSLAMVTALAPKIGYDVAAQIAKESLKTGKTVRTLATEKKVLPPDELTRLLDARRQTGA
ncbi:MAG: class II fumarate hydratase [Deltaproteobacteria bacterium]|nr:class II fumarate hydratase [Deltaproteobacteria bacterium]